MASTSKGKNMVKFATTGFLYNGISKRATQYSSSFSVPYLLLIKGKNSAAAAADSLAIFFVSGFFLNSFLKIFLLGSLLSSTGILLKLVEYAAFSFEDAI